MGETEQSLPMLPRAVTPCLLCGRPPHVRGIFFARDQARVLAPRGKVRGVAYTLCRKCFRKGQATRQRVEAHIFGEFARAEAEAN